MRERHFKLDPRRAPGLVGLWGPGPPGGPLLYGMSGRGNDVTWSGTGTHWVADAERNRIVANFNGSDDYVDRGLFDLVDTGPFTVTVWVSIRGGDSNAGIISNNTGANYQGPFLMQRTGVGVSMFSGPENVVVTTSGTAWQHLALVRYPGAIGIEAFLNGESKDTDAGDTRAITGQKLLFGLRERTSQYLDGQIDDGRIYSRALSAAEIQHIVQSRDYSDIAMRPSRPLKAAAAAGLSIPIAMRHYLQMQGAG